MPSASRRKPNFARWSSGRESKQIEDPRLKLRLVDPEAPAAELVAVADQVVGMGQRPAGVLVEAFGPFRGGTREGMVHGRPAAGVLIPLEHREVGDPEPASRPSRRRAGARGPRAAEAQRAPSMSSATCRRRTGRWCPGRSGSAQAPARRGTWRSGSAPRPTRRTRDTQGPSRPTASRPPRAPPSSLRENACGTRRNRTASAPANTPNCDSRVTAVASSSSSSSRRSGLSEPKRRSASSYVSRENGTASSTPTHSRQIAAIVVSISEKRNSWSGNDSSTSSWVISWTRSARRSSSRKQIAIW